MSVGAIPDPLSGIMSGVPLCVVVTLKVLAGAEPRAPGVKVIAMLHEERAVSCPFTEQVVAPAKVKPFPGVTEIAPMVTEVGWLLASVTDMAPLVAPTTIEPNATEEGDKVTGSTPVAENVTCCGLLLAVVSRVRVPVETAPRAVGSTVTATVQVAPAPRLPGCGQVLLPVEIA